MSADEVAGWVLIVGSLVWLAVALILHARKDSR